MTSYVPRYLGEIIRCEVGSGLHGTGLPGKEDRDEMGVCLEGQETTIGLGRFEQHTWRSQPEGQRSGPGDIDLTVYSARKFLRLAAKGNPSILLLFFVPKSHQVFCTPTGRSLQELAPLVISRQVVHPYLGYMRAQYERLVGKRHGRHINRPELETQFGYDTKYAMHMLRLGYQGIELLTTARVRLPIPSPTGDLLRSVRRGEIVLSSVLEEYRRLERILETVANNSPLRQEPDMAALNEWLLEAHYEHWGVD